MPPSTSYTPRGIRFRGGFHDYNIDRGGLTVFPRLIASEHRMESELQLLSRYPFRGPDHAWRGPRGG